MLNVIEIISNNFIGGVGIGNFSKYYNEFQALYFKTHIDAKNEFLASYIVVAYNEYLQFILEAGIIGFAFIGVFFWKIIKFFNKCIGTKDHLSIISVVGCVSILSLGLFSYPFQSLPVLSNLIVLLAILAQKDDTKIFDVKVRWTFLIYPLLILNIIMLSAGLLRYNNLLQWINLSSYVTKNKLNVKKVDSLYAKLLPSFGNDALFLEDYAGRLFEYGQYSKAIKLLNQATKTSSSYSLFITLGKCHEKKDNILLAEQSYLEACYLVPNKFYPRFLLMMLYHNNGYEDRAKKWASIILEMPIKVESIIVENIRNRAEEILSLRP